MTEHQIISLVEDQVAVVRRREQIVRAAAELFSNQGFYRTTMKEVAKAAGMSAGLIYQYVREKDDVLLLVLLEVLGAYAREIPLALQEVSDPLQRLSTSISAYCRVVDRHRLGTVLAYRSTKSLAPAKRRIVQAREVETNDIIAAEVRNCMRLGLIRETNAELLTYQMVMIAHAWALKSWYLQPLIDLDGYIEQTIRTVLVGELTPAGRKRFDKLSKSAKAPA